MKKPIFIFVAAVSAIVEIIIFKPILSAWCKHIEATESANPAVINGYHALSVAIFLLAISALIPLIFLIVGILRRERHWKLALLVYCFPIVFLLMMGVLSR